MVAEAPSYVGALGVFRAYQAEVVHVPMDDDGLEPEALRRDAHRGSRAGRRVKLLYTVPNFHNPAGVTLSPSAGRGSSRSPGATASSCSRTTRTACSASTATRCPRCARTTPRA